MATMVAGEPRFFQSVTTRLFHASRTPKCILRSVESWFKNLHAWEIIIPCCTDMDQLSKFQGILDAVTKKIEEGRSRVVINVIYNDPYYAEEWKIATSHATKAWNRQEYGWHITSNVLERIAKIWHQKQRDFSFKDAVIHHMALGLVAKQHGALVINVGCPPMAAFYQSLLLREEDDDNYVPVLAFK